MKKFLLSLFVCLTAYVDAQNVPMYVVDPQSDELTVYDTLAWASTSAVFNLTSSTGTVDGCNGLAVQPCTGIIYVAYKSGGARYLGTLDTASAFITEIGNLGDNVANICFGAQNRLYAVTGDGASTPETLFEVNLTTAAMTLKVTLGNGDDGEAIAFNPDNGLIYHWSGIGGGNIMESIDTTTNLITPIALTGYDFSEITSATYLGGDKFLITGFSDFIVVDINGFADVPVGSPDNTVKGMIFPMRFIENQTASSICPNDSALFVATAGDSYNWFLDGNPLGLTTPTIYGNSAGVYTCDITIETCVNVSNPLTLQLYTLPVVTLSPSPTALLCPTVGSVLLTGTSGGTSQWYLNGAPISGATNSTYSATAVGLYNMTKTNTSGCSDSAAVGTTVIIDPCDVGVEESNISFSIYPNPAAAELVVHVANWNQSELVSIDIFSLDGKLILSDNWTGGTIYKKDVSGLETGIYIIEFSTNDEKIVRRFVKR